MAKLRALDGPGASPMALGDSGRPQHEAKALPCAGKISTPHLGENSFLCEVLALMFTFLALLLFVRIYSLRADLTPGA